MSNRKQVTRKDKVKTLQKLLSGEIKPADLRTVQCFVWEKVVEGERVRYTLTNPENLGGLLGKTNDLTQAEFDVFKDVNSNDLYLIIEDCSISI